MGRLLFLAVSKWNLLFIILKDDGKRWEHLFFFISGREEAAIQPSTHTRVRTRSRASHISISLLSADGLYLCYDSTFSLTRVGTPHFSFMTNLSVVVGGRLYSGCRNSFLNSIIFLWMIHGWFFLFCFCFVCFFFTFFFLNASRTWSGFLIQGTFHILVLMMLWQGGGVLVDPRVSQHPWTSPASSVPSNQPPVTWRAKSP